MTAWTRSRAVMTPPSQAAKYSVVGAHFNLTSRIESFALGGQVLISAATFERVQDLVEIGDVLSAEMKGIPGQVTLYEVRSIGGPYNIQLKARQETLVELAAPFNINLHRIREKVCFLRASRSPW